MANYKLTNKAVEDLANIWNYTYEEWSEQQADHYYEMLISSCEEIAKKHNIGKEYSEIAENLLGLRSNKHIIFYRILEDYIEITRILHGSMDLKSRILD